MGFISSLSRKGWFHSPKKQDIVLHPHGETGILEFGGILSHLDDLLYRFPLNLTSLNNRIISNISRPNLQWLITEMKSDMSRILEMATSIRVSFEGSAGRIDNGLIELAVTRLEDISSLLEKFQGQHENVVQDLAEFALSEIPRDFHKELEWEIKERKKTIAKIKDNRSKLNQEIQKLRIIFDSVSPRDVTGKDKRSETLNVTSKEKRSEILNDTATDKRSETSDVFFECSETSNGTANEKRSKMPNVLNQLCVTNGHSTNVDLAYENRRANNKIVSYSLTGIAVAVMSWYIVSSFKHS